MTKCARVLSGLALLVAAGCGSSDDGTGGGGDAGSRASTGAGALTEYKACAADKLVGEFILKTDSDTQSSGFETSSVGDAVNPIRVPVEVKKSGACRVFQPPKGAAPTRHQGTQRRQGDPHRDPVAGDADEERRERLHRLVAHVPGLH
jgi:hypothetical protein